MKAIIIGILMVMMVGIGGVSLAESPVYHRNEAKKELTYSRSNWALSILSIAHSLIYQNHFEEEK